jgi:hypothetical protein
VANRFYFAWVDPNETTFVEGTHKRQDEDVFEIAIEHAEGEFAGLTIVIRNPKVGLLSPGRKVWAWLSWEDDAGTTHPLFFGRLVAIPSNINQEVVTFQFLARPADYFDLKEALAETLRVAPYWDPVFVAPDRADDPDVVLEARSAIWHIDRVTHDVTISDLLTGEDTLEDFTGDEIPYDSVAISLKEQPARAVQIIAEVHWTQAHKGSGIKLYQNESFGPCANLALESVWPKTDASLGGGWTVQLGRTRNDVDHIATVNRSVTAVPAEGGQAATLTSSLPVPEPNNFKKYLTAAKEETGVEGASSSSSGFYLALPIINVDLTLKYVAAREFTEVIQFQVSSDVQPVITLAGEEDVPILSLTGADVGLPVPGSLTPPLHNATSRSYFPTNRGRTSIEYLLNIARATLMLKSRAVEIVFHVPFERAIALNCRKSARMHDPRIPGGEASGKIIRYVIRTNGDTGEMIGEITLAASVGTGGAQVADAGTPTYVEEGYVDVGYQEYANQIVVLGTSDVGYKVPTTEPNDDGLRFPVGKSNMFVEDPHVTVPVYVEPSLHGVLPDDIQSTVLAVANAQEAALEFTLVNLTDGKFTTVYELETTTLKIPSGVNLGGL